MIVRQPNTGPGGARNVGSVIAHAPLIAFLDADDRWRPGKLEKQVALHERRPELVLSATDFVHFDDKRELESSAWRTRTKPDGEQVIVRAAVLRELHPVQLDDDAALRR